MPSPPLLKEHLVWTKTEQALETRGLVSDFVSSRLLGETNRPSFNKGEELHNVGNDPALHKFNLALTSVLYKEAFLKLWKGIIENALACLPCQGGQKHAFVGGGQRFAIIL